MMKKFFKIIALILLSLLLLVVLILIVSLRPVDRTHFTEQDYYKKTVARIGEVRSGALTGKGQLWVGTSTAGLTPPVGVPLAGYGDRKGAPSTGVHDSLFIRVIGLRSGDAEAYLIGYDALLLHPPLARLVEEKIKTELSIEPEQLYFTATHSHSGPGGWGSGFVEEQFAGPPSPEVLPFFIDSTVAAIARARADFAPAGFKHISRHAPDFIRNRLVGDKGQIDDELFSLAFYRNKNLAATFTTFSAHATSLSGRNMQISGDYPGYFERAVESAAGGVAVFAAAGLGSHSYRSKGEGFDKPAYVGNGLADSLIKALEGGTLESEGSLRCFRLPIELPSHQVRITNSIRLAPWLARRLFKANDAYIQVLELNDIVLFGSPGEFSGELALEVKEHARSLGKRVTITSFNGCYLGYVTPSRYYNMNSYETRLMSWFGPYTGDMLVDLMKQLLE